MKMHIKLVFFSLFLIRGTAFADVKSTTGTIKFDSNSDGQIESTLTTTGLGLGTNTPSANLHVQGNAIVSNQLFVGTTHGNSTLQVQGSLGFGVETASASTALSGNTVVFGNTSSSNVVLYLPDAKDVAGRTYKLIKKSSSNRMLILGSRIDNADQVEIASGNYGSVGLLASGNQWYITENRNLTLTSSANLVGYWSMNEASGFELKDHSSYQTSLTMTNFGTSGNGHISGKMGNGLTYDGSDDVVNLSDPADGRLDVVSSGGLSISLWLKTTTSLNRYLLHKGGDSGLKGYYMTFRPNDLRVQVGDGTSNVQAIATGGVVATVDNGSWHHIVAVIDPGSSQTTKIYVDNSLVRSQDISTIGDMSNAYAFTLGYPGAPSLSESISVDEYRVYNKALSASEVQELYNMGN